MTKKLAEDALNIRAAQPINAQRYESQGLVEPIGPAWNEEDCHQLIWNIHTVLESGIRGWGDYTHIVRHDMPAGGWNISLVRIRSDLDATFDKRQALGLAK